MNEKIKSIVGDVVSGQPYSFPHPAPFLYTVAGYIGMSREEFDDLMSQNVISSWKGRDITFITSTENKQFNLR